jgi:Holliday junction DNA helicase RuvA
MIAQLTGTVVAKAVDQIVLDVHDVGYRVFIPLSTYYELPPLKAPVSLLIHTHVREDTWQLFGFLTVDERDLFEALLRVTKVGPKLALAMLSGMSAGDVQRAVIEADVQRLSAIPGVGRKTAERIILELRDKLAKGKPELPGEVGPSGQAQAAVVDAVTALQNLGYPRMVAERTVQEVWRRADASPTLTLKDLIRGALRVLGQEKGDGV